MWASTDTNLNYISGQTARTDPSHAVLRLLKRAFGAVPEWFQREAWRSELASLDDRTLADLAINRGDFPAILAGNFARPPVDGPERRQAGAASRAAATPSAGAVRAA